MQQYFEHRLDTETIVIRQDNDVSKFIEENAGIYYPLIKIHNTVIPFGDVVSLSLSVGDTFLPRLSVTIDDTTYQFREVDFETQLSYITVFIGNPRDTVYKPIKNTYVVLSISSDPGSTMVSFEAELNVPKLYATYHLGIQGTSFNAIKQIAKDSGLGFVSNVKNTNDEMFWISPGTRYAMIFDSIMQGAYKSEDNSFFVFVDQYANLNFIDLRKAFVDAPTVIQETDILTGNKLDEPYQLALSNNTLDRRNELLIIAYTPINYYGELAKDRADKLLYSELDVSYTNETSGSVIGSDQLFDTKAISVVSNINTHSRYQLGKELTKYNRYILQGTKIDCVLDYFAPSAYLYATIPVHLYTTPSKTRKDESNQNENLVDISENEPVQTPNAHILNERLSGDMIITRMSYEYRRPASEEDDRIRIHQSLRLFKK